MRIGHEDVEAYEHQRHQHVRKEVDEQTQRWRQQFERREFAGHGGHKERETRGEHNQDGAEQHHGQIISESAEDAARLLHMPDAIEGALHIAHQHQHRIEHEHKTEADENATLGVEQITVDKADDDLGRLGLRLEGVEKPDLNVLVVAETAGDGKHHGQDGHDG